MTDTQSESQERNGKDGGAVSRKARKESSPKPDRQPRRAPDGSRHDPAETAPGADGAMGAALRAAFKRP